MKSSCNKTPAIRSMNAIINEHDKFFKEVLSHAKMAKQFLEIYLPVDLKAVVDCNDLVLEDRNFLNELREHAEVDVLYKTHINQQQAYLYCLLEHQSTIDQYMPLRILNYVVQIMRRHAKLHKSAKLPLVYPMVIYQGPQQWPYSTDLKSLIDAPGEWVDRYFLKPFRLIDLSQIQDADLKQHASIGVFEMLLKHVFDQDMLDVIQDLAGMMHDIVQHEGKNIVECMLQYALNKGQISQQQEFFHIIKDQISPEVEEPVMTLAQQFEQKGMQRGARENSVQIAKSMLLSGLEAEFVAKHTGLSLSEVLELASQQD